MNMKMKVRVYEVINGDGEILREIITGLIPKKEADTVAFEKLKFLYPYHYIFAQLKYKGVYVR